MKQLTLDSLNNVRIQGSFKVIVLLTLYLNSQGGGLFGQKDNYHTLGPRYSGNATSPTVKKVIVRGSHQTSFHTYTILTWGILHTNQRQLSRDCPRYDDHLQNVSVGQEGKKRRC